MRDQFYKDAMFFSKRDVQEIVGFAALWGIEVVPEIDLPAHTAALIVAAKSVGQDVGTIELHEGCADRLGDATLTAAPNCMGGTHGIVLPTQQARRCAD